MRVGSPSSVEVGAVTYGRTPGRLIWRVAGWNWVRWLTVFLVGVGLVLAGWVTFGSSQADAQTLMLLDEADCDHDSGIHLPDGYDSLDPSLQPAVVADCKALVAIRNHFLFGADGTERLNRGNVKVRAWGTSANTQIDDWDGLTFDSTTGRVQRIYLVGPFQKLSGTIPPAIGDLGDLRRLQLSTHELTGMIPDLSDLTNLERLHLSGNRLSGPIPDLSALTSLLILDLGDNMFTGQIPDTLKSLTGLTHLWLYDNMLSGPIPAWLNSLTSLVDLILDENMLTGEIPDLSEINGLFRLELNDNMLSGPIPAWLNSITRLISLKLFNNRLSGSIPDLSALTSLPELDLSRNMLSGSIPATLNSLTVDRKLDLSHNMLTGEIPDLSALTNLKTLLLNNNMLSGSIPATLNSLTSLTSLKLFNNRLSGSIPDLSALTSLPELDLSHNRLTGEIPATLNSLTDLRELNLSHNMLTGTIPDLSALASLIELDLSNNGLSGQIPATLNGLTTNSNLWNLFLQSNDLEGPVPDLGGPGLVLEYLWLCDNPRLMIDSSALEQLEDQVGLISSVYPFRDGRLCVGPAPVVEVLTPGDGEVVFSWTFDGLPTVSHFQYRSLPRVRENEIAVYNGYNYVYWVGSEVSSYDHFYWTDVRGGASANSVTVTKLTGDPIYPHDRHRREGRLVTGETYEFWVRAVYEAGGTSHWQVFQATAGVAPPPEPPSEVVVGDAESVVEGGKLVFPVEVPDGVSGSFRFRAAPASVPSDEVAPNGFARLGEDFVVVSVRERGVTRLEDGWFRMTVESGGDFSIELQTQVDGTVEPIERAVLEVVGEDGLTVTDMRGSDRPRGDIMDVGESDADTMDEEDDTADGDDTPPESTPTGTDDGGGDTGGGPPGSQPDETGGDGGEGDTPQTPPEEAGNPGSKPVDAGEEKGDDGDDIPPETTPTNPGGGPTNPGGGGGGPTNPGGGGGGPTNTGGGGGGGPTNTGGGGAPTNTGGGGGGGGPTNTGGGGGGVPTGGGSAPLDPGCRPGEFVGVFCDEDGSVHEANIEMLAGWKITLGCRENQFCPQAQISRSQMAAFLYRAVTRHAGAPPAGTAELPDVGESVWYRPFAEWSVASGVMSMVDGGFSPRSVVTRADMAVMLAAAFPDLIPQGEVTGMFTDTAGLDDATIRAMEGLHRAGVTLGCSTAPLRYCPNQSVTRAQMASFFVRVLTQPAN